MSLKSLPLFIFLALPVGCAQFQTGRSFLSEMEHDDTRFFEPRNDFPVVAGDTGRDWSTDKEMRARTPASERDVANDLHSRALMRELRSLEQSQSEESLEFYDKHKHQLSTTSEKIYFLKLPPYDRREYLMSRGFIEEPKTAMFSLQQRSVAMQKQDILLGMSKDDVLQSWGKPVRVEIAGNPRYENERWLYSVNGASKYIYFEAGQVGGWE